MQGEMIKIDCVFFRGDKPCQYQRLCEDCPHYKPFPTQILIIKGRAMGDVLRTTALLPGLKRKYSQSHITWLVDEESTALLLNNPFIDRIVPFQWQETLRFLEEEYDILISLDKEIPSTALATKIRSKEKFGFGINVHGHLTIFNKASHYAYRLGIDDQLKFHENKKTYQKIIYEACELDYQKDRYVFELREEDRKKAESFFKRNKPTRNSAWVGLNTGAGSRFETKRWPRERFLQLIRLLTEEQESSVFLLGGEKEEETNTWLQKKSQGKIYNTGSHNTLREFAGFLSFFDLVVSSDSLAMHLALALNKKVVVFFGSTAPQEIELYGLGRKIFSGVECAPCYKETCPDMKCMKAITAEEVYQEIKNLL